MQVASRNEKTEAEMEEKKDQYRASFLTLAQLVLIKANSGVASRWRDDSVS